MEVLSKNPANKKATATVELDQLDNEPTFPQLEPILVLHDNHDGYVTFSVKSDDDFRNQVAIRADELRNYFPQFLTDLAKDSLVSINAGYTLARDGVTSAQDLQTKPIGRPKHNSRTLKYLCANYVDLDYYKIPGLEAGDVIGAVIKLQDHGLLPPASIITRSGRGVWLLWLLRDAKDPEKFQGAYPDKIELYARIQRAIVQRLANLGADGAGTDAVRHIRIPGSLHTSSERPVTWWPQYDQGGKGYVYSLAELAQFFGLKERSVNPRVRELFADHQQRKQKNLSKRAGWIALNQRRWRDFETLRAIRGGGFEDGCRGMAALVYAWIVNRNGVLQPAAEGMVADMALHCHPPLSAGRCRDAIKTAFRKGKDAIRKMTDQGIADKLGITPAEVAAGGLGFPPASKFQDQSQQPAKLKPESRGAAPKARRDHILKVIESEGRVLPSREMAEILKRIGFSGNHVTVAIDYKELGLKTERIKQKQAAAERREKQGRIFPAAA
jgi:hypothetical protein